MEIEFWMKYLFQNILRPRFFLNESEAKCREWSVGSIHPKKKWNGSANDEWFDDVQLCNKFEIFVLHILHAINSA